MVLAMRVAKVLTVYTSRTSVEFGTLCQGRIHMKTKEQ